MTGAQKLLALWYKKAGQSYANEMPTAAAPLGLLMNYLENPANSIAERWTTFSWYVQAGADPQEQNLVVSGLLSLKNQAEDAALEGWKWSSDDQNAAVNAMAKYSAPADQPKAYQTLAAYSYEGKPLPLKVGAGVALKYIAKIL